MTRQNAARDPAEVKGMFAENSEALRKMVQDIVQDVLNGKKGNYLEAGPYERTETRRGCRIGLPISPAAVGGGLPDAAADRQNFLSPYAFFFRNRC